MNNRKGKLKVLINGNLIDLPQQDVERELNEALAFAIKHEKYNLAVKLRNAKTRYLKQLEERNKPK